MIKIILSDAINDIAQYLADYPDVYSPAMRERILAVVDVMAQLRDDLRSSYEHKGEKG